MIACIKFRKPSLKAKVPILVPFRKYSSKVYPKEAIKLAFLEYQPPSPQQPSEIPPLVILHGLFGSKQNWKSLARAFSQRLNTRVLTLDLRNHGESPHSPVHNYEGMANDVASFLSDHKLHKIILIGHSMGGKVAMYMALQHVPYIEKLVVVDNAPLKIRLSTDFAKYIEGMKKIEETKLTKQSIADEILQEFESDISIRQFLLTNLKKDPKSGVYKFRIPLEILGESLEKLGDFPFESAHHTYHKPTLFIAGTRSNYVPLKAHQTIKTFFPESVIVNVNAGHWVHAEKPQEFLMIVSDFIKSGQVVS
ncbi:hypothetical protein G9A89_006892 [Geosiphon pyriformis]|nr:hypothetical protein G9A89_006892 [Geosiphon pyriformis]